MATIDKTISTAAASTTSSKKTAAAKSKGERKKLVHFSHFMLPIRFDVWLQLLWQNKFHILPRKIPQALLITLLSLIFFPFALIERLLLAIPVRRTQPNQPLFILGHWRSGTTYLQNIISRDRSFGFFDPSSTNTFNNYWMLKPLLAPAYRDVLPDARPMDNIKYSMEMPMEEVFSIAASSNLAIVDMLVFPKNAFWYLECAFVDELPAQLREKWARVYTYILKKHTWISKGKPLILKSPDSTARAAEIYRLYPDSRFINIFRNPYAVIPSTINMFKKLFDLMTLQEAPDDELLENMIISNFARVYRKLFSDMEKIPAGQFIEVKYEDFEQQPLHYLEEIYTHLRIPGFEQAKKDFTTYADSQRNYVKNKFNLAPEMIEKINSQCGFYFERYGYDMINPESED